MCGSIGSLLPSHVNRRGGSPSSPDGRELVAVAMTINEADENLQNEETDLGVLHEGGGEKAVQEVAGQGRHHVVALETCGHLRGSPGRPCLGTLPSSAH